MGSGMIEQLQQLQKVTWDGDLISKSQRDALVKCGYVVRCGGGWNLITKKGVEVLVNIGLLKA
jgi:hypothetical protein